VQELNSEISKLTCRHPPVLPQLLPAPRWKLVVEVGHPTVTTASTVGPTEEEKQQQELLSLIESKMPENKGSPFAAYLPGFTSLRLLLTRKPVSQVDNTLTELAVEIYSSHKSAGQPESEIAWMTARDFMQMSKQKMSQLPVAASNQQTTMQGRPMIAGKQPVNRGNTDGCGCSPGEVCGPISSSTSEKTNNSVSQSGTDQRTLTAGNSILPQGESEALASPVLQGIVGQNDVMGNLGLSASQIAALLQHDAAFSNLEGI